MEKVIQFFDYSLPCPEEVTDCQGLRNQYSAELEEARKKGGCPPCIERNLRNKYILTIQERIKKT